MSPCTVLIGLCLIYQAQAQFTGDPKIVGGDPVSIKNYPYQVSVQYNGEHICGGSIIEHSTIVTAAHCVIINEPDGLTIRAGSGTKSAGGVVVSVKGYRIHPLYDPTSLTFDLALIYLNDNLTYTETIQPISLSSQRLCGGSDVVASGWGAIYKEGPLSETLLSVQLKTIPYDSCVKIYNPSVINGMFCAGEMAGGKDTCQGDSGGPLVMDGELIGVTSHGTGCAKAGIPGIYTRIPLLRDWILEYTPLNLELHPPSPPEPAG